jgi:hypothetical protein
MEADGENRPIGRPSKYLPEYADQAYKLALLGLTLPEIAIFFDVAPSTVSLWKEEHPAFSEAIARGGTCADAEVAAKLRDRALGYSHEAVKIFMPAGAKEPVYAKYIEHYPPDTHAVAMWLWNRQPAKWRKTRDTQGDGDGSDAVTIVGGLPD